MNTINLIQATPEEVSAAQCFIELFDKLNKELENKNYNGATYKIWCDDVQGINVEVKSFGKVFTILDDDVDHFEPTDYVFTATIVERLNEVMEFTDYQIEKRDNRDHMLDTLNTSFNCRCIYPGLPPEDFFSNPLKDAVEKIADEYESKGLLEKTPYKFDGLDRFNELVKKYSLPIWVKLGYNSEEEYNIRNEKKEGAISATIKMTNESRKSFNEFFDRQTKYFIHLYGKDGELKLRKPMHEFEFYKITIYEPDLGIRHDKEKNEMYIVVKE